MVQTTDHRVTSGWLFRYEGSIDSGMMKIIVMIWYLYALIATSSYAGEIRSFFINPGTTAPLGEKIQLLITNTSQTRHSHH